MRTFYFILKSLGLIIPLFPQPLNVYYINTVRKIQRCVDKVCRSDVNKTILGFLSGGVFFIDNIIITLWQVSVRR